MGHTLGPLLGRPRPAPPAPPPTFGPCRMCGQPARVPLAGAAYCLACAGAALDRAQAEFNQSVEAVLAAVREDLAASRRKYSPRP